LGITSSFLFTQEHTGQLWWDYEGNVNSVKKDSGGLNFAILPNTVKPHKEE
jgi:hypothetical protein